MSITGTQQAAAGATLGLLVWYDISVCNWSDSDLVSDD